MVTHMVTAAWGSWHVEQLLRVALPSLLAEDNLPAFAKAHPVRYVITTTRTDAERIRGSSVLQKIASLAEVELRYLDEDDIRDPIETHHRVWAEAVKRARKQRALLLLLPPDVVFSEGAFGNLARLVSAGKRVIYNMYLRAQSETFVPELLDRFGSADGALRIGVGVAVEGVAFRGARRAAARPRSGVAQPDVAAPVRAMDRRVPPAAGDTGGLPRGPEMVTSERVQYERGLRMNVRMLVCGFVLGAGTALVSTEILSAGEPDFDDARMKLYQKYALPGPFHDKMEFFEGEWDVTTKIWMEGPDAPPALSTATVSHKFMFGDRFLQTTMRGTINLEINGEVMAIPTEAIGYLGYDNFKEKYVSVWIDSYNTGIHYAEGNVDETGKIFTYFATMDVWEENARDRPYKMVDRIVDDNTIVSEVHDLIVQGETRIFEMVSKRRLPPKAKAKTKAETKAKTKAETKAKTKAKP